MISREGLEQLKPFQARAIIEDLRKGSVPIDYVSFFTVGRENWLKLIEDDLDHYIAQGGTKVRFINGDYGDGKTHFMSVVRHMAMQKGFAVSFVVLTHAVPMQKFEVVYQEVVRQLRVSPRVDEDSSQPGPASAKGFQVEGTGIRRLLEAWVESVAAGWAAPSAPAQESSGAGSEAASLQDRLAGLGDALRTLSGMDLNFANGLIALLDNRLSPLREGEAPEERTHSREILFQWFEGSKVTKRDLKPFEIFEPLNKTNSKRLLSSLVAFLRYLGYRGLILLMDELEAVIAQSASTRNAAYENVRLLIDNTEQAQYLHIFFSIIPDVLLSEKGFKAYDALWSRVRSLGESKRLNYRSVLIDLHRTPLETREMIDLGLCLRRIHELSYRWEATDVIGDGLIEQICENQKRMGLLSEVRLFVKQIIRCLDMAEQGEPPDETTDFAERVVEAQRELEQEKMEQFEPKWDA
jgi:hypothetical protein